MLPCVICVRKYGFHITKSTQRKKNLKCEICQLSFEIMKFAMLLFVFIAKWGNLITHTKQFLIHVVFEWPHPFSCITYHFKVHFYVCCESVTHKKFKKIHVHGRVFLCEQLKNFEKACCICNLMQYIFIDLSICYIMSLNDQI